MRRGLHLGRRGPRARGVAIVVLVALVAGASLQSARVIENRRAAATLRTELESLQARLEASEPNGDAGDFELVSRLRAVVASGALDALPPTALIDLLDGALPDGVVVTGLSIKASPPGPSMTVEAIASMAETVTELQRRIQASPLVRATSVLDERRAADGMLSVRLQVDLDRGGLP